MHVFGLRQNKGKITENSENHCLDKTVKVNLIHGLKLLQKPPTHGPAKAARTELCLSFGQIIDNFFSRCCFVITFTAVNFIATLQCFITEETKMFNFVLSQTHLGVLIQTMPMWQKKMHSLSFWFSQEQRFSRRWAIWGSCTGWPSSSTELETERAGTHRQGRVIGY